MPPTFLRPTAPVLTVGRVTRDPARRLPDRIALADERTRLSFAELDRQVDAVASWLRGAGVGRGDTVATRLPNGVEPLVVALGAARAGATIAPLNPRLRIGELGALLAQARPAAMFVAAGEACAVRGALAAAGTAGAALVTVDGGAAGCVSYEHCLATARAELPEVAEDDPFSLLFTSGTTGAPKGAVGSHRARMMWVLNAAIEYGLGGDDLYLSAMPLVHSAGLTVALMHLYVGASVRVMRRFDAPALLAAIEREQVTSLLAVPTMLAAVVETLDGPGPHPSTASLRRVLSCGAPLSPALRRRVIEQVSDRLWDYYGATESPSMTVLRPEDQLRKPASVGRAFRHVDLRIAGPGGAACGPEEVGEVWCAGPSVMTGYLDRPDDTAARFDGRWYRTGDLGWLDDEGFLHLAGRTDDVIVSGGVNIHPAEIEQALMTHPDVLEAAVAGRPDERWGQVVCAFVVPRGDAMPGLERLQAHVSAQLADYKKPRRLVRVESLPKNLAGKTLRRLLPD